MKRLLLCAALLAWSGLASAFVYKWVDAEGKIHYGDRPPDGVHAELVDLLGTHESRAGRPNSGTPAPDSKTAAPDAGDATKKAVEEDVATAHEKQCADAQARYKQLIEGRKLYKTGADGERQYLTSDEIDAMRLSAKQDVDTNCNSST